MKDIHSFFKAQDFIDAYSVGLLDTRHIIINFNGERDFLRLYSRILWYIGDFPMRVFKWTPDFHVQRESSLVPIWFNFPKLPIHFFNSQALGFLASLFGTPLRLDAATKALKRPSVARIQVEIDVTKPPPSRVWIGTGENQGFWQKVEADEDIPLYCQFCWHVGHGEDNCTVKHPHLKKLDTEAPQADRGSDRIAQQRHQAPPTQARPSHSRLEYRPVEKPNAPVGSSGLSAAEKSTIVVDVPSMTSPPDPPLKEPCQPSETQPHRQQTPVHQQQQQQSNQQVSVQEPSPAADQQPPPIPANTSQVLETDTVPDIVQFPFSRALSTPHSCPVQPPRPPLDPARSLSDVDLDYPDQDRAQQLAVFRSFSTFIAPLVARVDHVSDDEDNHQWEVPKRRKPYTKRNYGRSTMRTRSQSQRSGVFYDD